MCLASNLNTLENLLFLVSTDEYLASSHHLPAASRDPERDFLSGVTTGQQSHRVVCFFVSKHWPHSRHLVQSTERKISGLVKRMLLVTISELSALSTD